jgi:hypothetical protein
MGKLALVTAVAVCAAIEIVSAKAEIVPVSTTIQAAVDAAKPGDIVRHSVRPFRDMPGNNQGFEGQHNHPGA